jgi:hypothetical protein
MLWNLSAEHLRAMSLEWVHGRAPDVFAANTAVNGSTLSRDLSPLGPPTWSENLIPPAGAWVVTPEQARPHPAQYALTLDAFTTFVTVRGVPDTPVWALVTGAGGASGRPWYPQAGDFDASNPDAWAGLLPPLVTLHTRPAESSAPSADQPFNVRVWGTFDEWRQWCAMGGGVFRDFAALAPQVWQSVDL